MTSAFTYGFPQVIKPPPQPDWRSIALRLKFSNEVSSIWMEPGTSPLMKKSRPWYLVIGSVQDRLADFNAHYQMNGGFSKCPSVKREERWGLAKHQIESDYLYGYITESEYVWCKENGLLNKDYALTM